jgi:hypothetical protein
MMAEKKAEEEEEEEERRRAQALATSWTRRGARLGLLQRSPPMMSL